MSNIYAPNIWPGIDDDITYRFYRKERNKQTNNKAALIKLIFSNKKENYLALTMSTLKHNN